MLKKSSQAKRESITITLEDNTTTGPLVLLGTVGSYVICYDAKKEAATLYNIEGTLTLNKVSDSKPSLGSSL